MLKKIIFVVCALVSGGCFAVLPEVKSEDFNNNFVDRFLKGRFDQGDEKFKFRSQAYRIYWDEETGKDLHFRSATNNKRASYIKFDAVDGAGQMQRKETFKIKGNAVSHPEKFIDAFLSKRRDRTPFGNQHSVRAIGRDHFNRDIEMEGMNYSASETKSADDKRSDQVTYTPKSDVYLGTNYLLPWRTKLAGFLVERRLLGGKDDRCAQEYTATAQTKREIMPIAAAWAAAIGAVGVGAWKLFGKRN